MGPSNKGKKFESEVYTATEIDAVLKVISRRAPTGVRNRALLVMGYRCGLRLAEALALNLKDVDLNAGYVHVRHGKGGKTRKVGIDAQAAAVVQLWMDRRQKLNVKRSAPLFCTLDGEPLEQAYIRALLARLGKKAGIEKRLHFHGLRHTYAWELSQESVPVRKIQGLLGHSHLQTTAIYLAHIAPHDLIEVAHNRPAWGASR
jgi:site-specific recombinase XerD